jgi:hypothetical protein
MKCLIWLMEIERAPAVDANDLPIEVEERPAAVAGVDRRVNLDAIGVF